MKKFLLVINIALVAAVIALYVLFFTYHQKGAGKNIADVSTEEGVAATPGEIVYLQLDSLINNYDFYKDLDADLASKAQAIQDDLQKKGRSFEKDVNDFQQKVQKGLITRSHAETQQAQLEKRQQDLQQYQQQKQMEMAEEQQVMMNRVMDAIRTYIKQYNQSHGYALIITTTANTVTVVDGEARLDITADLIKGLNAEYAAGTKK